MKHTSLDVLLPGATPLHMPRAVRAVLADGDPNKILAQLAKDFADFKAENDAKLKSKADVLVDEKVQRIDASVGALQSAIDKLNADLAAAQLGAGVSGKTPEDLEYAKAFASHFRKGDVQAALTKGSDVDGGYYTPVEWDRTVTNQLKLVSPIRAHASVQAISASAFKKLYNDRAVGSGWVGETAARPETTTPQLAILDFTLGEIYANPAASQQLLDDALVDIEAWLAEEVQTEFARQEGIAFLSGNGVNKPFGLLTYATGAANAAKHPWGAIPVVVSGAAAALTADGILSLIYDLPGAYSANAKFFSNRQTMSAMRKLKDGQNNYLWQPSFQAGQPATLAGEQLVDVPDMPGVAAGNLALAYGDMAETYLIVDRIGIRVLRDPYTNKPFVMFYTTKRVGGAVKNPAAMRFQKISA